MKGGPTDPPNSHLARHVYICRDTSMKGGPTDPTNYSAVAPRVGRPSTSMKGGPTDPPNPRYERPLPTLGCRLQ